MRGRFTNALAGVASLVDKSLLKYKGSRQDGRWVAILPMLKQFMSTQKRS